MAPLSDSIPLPDPAANVPAESGSYLRAEMAVPVTGSSEAHNFGVWVSLDPQDLERYLGLGTWDAQNPITGWLTHDLSIYQFSAALRANIYPHPDGGAPIAQLASVDHPFAQSLKNGVAPERIDELRSILARQ